MKAAVCFRAASIALAIAFAFGPALRGGWLWDDAAEISHNPALRDFSGLGRIWTGDVGADYLPLKSTVQWVAWQLWRDHVLGYHLLNAVLHFIGALLVWRLLAKLREAHGAGHAAGWEWLGGLLFAVHPLTVESVAWISELKNALSLPPLLLALCAYVDFDSGGRRRDLVRAVTWFLAAMLCKSSVVMLPVVLLLYAWWRRRQLRRRDILASVPFFLVSLVLGLVTIWFQQQRAIAPSGLELELGGIGFRLANAGRALAFYFSKCVFPLGLLPIYPRWETDALAWRHLASGLGIAVVATACWRCRATWGRHALLGLGFFALNLIPVLGWVPMSYLRISWVADHFAYVPLIGIVGLSAAGVAWLRLHRARLASALALGAALALAIVGRHHARHFRSERDLWAHTVRHNPAAWEAQKSLSHLLLQEGDVAGAITHGQHAVRLKPNYAEAHNNLANALLAADRPADAAAHYQTAVQLRPTFADAHFNLAAVLLPLGRVGEAAHHAAEAARLAPADAEAHCLLAHALAQLGRTAEARAHYQIALRLRPNYTDALTALARLP